MPRRPPTPDLAPLDRAVLGPHGLAGLDETELARLYASLTDTERADLARLLASQPKPLWTPLPGPQTWAYNSDADNLFYGGSAGGGKCVSGTILLANGEQRHISDVKVGDEVVAIDLGERRHEARRVIAVHRSGVKAALCIMADSADVVASRDHRFLRYGETRTPPVTKHHWVWTRAEDLCVGDVLLTLHDGTTDLKIVQRIDSIEPCEMWDLTVDGLHSFVCNGFVTHNSDLILGLALTRHTKSIIFRRQYPQLKDIILRSQELLGGTEARFNSQTGVWRNIPGGRLLEFGAVQYEHDVNKYKGRPHSAKLFDEITEFSRKQFEFLIAWLRTTIQGERTRVVCTGNPPTTPEGEWVLDYWGPWLNTQHPHPAEPGQLRWYAMIDGKHVEREDGRPFAHKTETIVPRSRTFVPASLDDNPYLKSTGYGAVLQNLPEPLRSQLLYGSFRAALNDNPWQVIPTEWIEAAQARWRANPARPVGVPMTGLGVDPAHGGEDDSTLCARYGTWFGNVQAVPGKRTPDGASMALLVMRTVQDGAHVAMDAGPWGASAYDALKEEDIRLTGINFAEWVDDTDRSGRLKFSNMRSWLYWSLREALDPASGENLSLPPDPELLADLAAPKWLPRGGRIYIESKKELRERLGRSPGKGDAVMLAWAAGGKSFQLDFA